MNTKKCPTCGRQIFEEAHFCPYCMTKFVGKESKKISSENTTGKRKIKIFIMAEMIGIVILAVVVITMMLFRTNKTNSAVGECDYSEYLGIWMENATDSPDMFIEKGGRKVEVCKANKDEIVVNIASVPDYGETLAHIDYLTVKLVDGEGVFSFYDDGFGNHGQGTIQLKDGQIHIETKLATEDRGGQWDIEMNTTLVRVEKMVKGQSIDISNLRGRYENIKCRLGERTKVEESDSARYYTHNKGMNISVQKNGPDIINEIDIYYERLDSDYKYNYKGVDNSFTREDVVDLLGAENIEEYNDEYVYSDIENGTSTFFYFDKNGYVSYIYYY